MGVRRKNLSCLGIDDVFEVELSVVFDGVNKPEHAGTGDKHHGESNDWVTDASHIADFLGVFGSAGWAGDDDDGQNVVENS